VDVIYFIFLLPFMRLHFQQMLPLSFPVIFTDHMSTPDRTETLATDQRREPASHMAIGMV
jgi:hypothetical protein